MAVDDIKSGIQLEGELNKMNIEIPDFQQVDVQNKHGHSFTPKSVERCPVRRYIIKDLIETIDFSLLPEGWLQVRHVSGLNIYLHRSTRVVTLSRPYFIGPGSVRRHQIPVSAIPCLAYRKASNHQCETSKYLKCDTRNEEPCPLNDLGTSLPCESITQVNATNLDEPNNTLVQITGRSSNDSSVDLESIQSLNNNMPGTIESQECMLLPTEIVDTDISIDSKCKRPHSDMVLSCKTPDKEIFDSDVNSTSSNHYQTSNKPYYLMNKRRRRKFGHNYFRKCAESNYQNSQLGISTSPDKTNTRLSNVDMPGFNAVKTQVFSIKDKVKECLLTADDIREYCGRLFEIVVEDFIPSRHQERSIHSEVINDTDGAQKPLLMMPERAKVIRYELPSVEQIESQLAADTASLDTNVAISANRYRKQPKEGMINMTGKSYVCILHEYCQNVIRRPPTYHTSVIENEKNPYEMTVLIGGKAYATGSGQSKKQARLEAARKALEVLIPDFQKIVGSDSPQTAPVVASDRDLQLFDSISINDPRLYELSVRMALPTPYNLLVECLNRSCVPETDLKSNMSSQGRSKHFFTLQFREHSIKVRCKNKREGRHLAAQHLLARLHPEATTWSNLLRMYGPGSKPDKRSELETIQDAQIQQKSTVKASLIRLLKTKMTELADQWEKSGGMNHPKGKFFVPSHNLPLVTFHPDSESDLYASTPLVGESVSARQPSSSPSSSPN